MGYIFNNQEAVRNTIIVHMSLEMFVWVAEPLLQISY